MQSVTGATIGRRGRARATASRTSRVLSTSVVNGHGYKMRKSDSTNFAVLVSQNFREPFDRPVAHVQKAG